MMRLGTALVMVVALAVNAGAQQTPEAAAAAISEAMRNGDWAAAARTMHPSAVRRLRDLFEPVLAVPGGGAEVGQRFFGVTSTVELGQLEDTVLYARFLKGTMSQQAGMEQALRSATLTTLGHIKVGGDTSLVVSRVAVTVEGLTITQFEVMPFVRDKGRWWGLLKADVTNMAEMMRRALGVGGS